MKAEYLNNKVTDLAIMHVMFILLCFFLPPYFIVKFLYNMLTYRSSKKDMAGKVVLLNGASSGIGEDINFWGNIYPTYFAEPHLRRSKGNIVVNSSVAAVLSSPKAGSYAASKAALLVYYESLRTELAPEITVTIVTLGFVESEMTQGKELSDKGVIEIDERFKEDFVKGFPLMGTEPCAKAIVDGACRGDRYITEPQFFRVFYVIKFLCPELIDWFSKSSIPAARDDDHVPNNILESDRSKVN